MSAAPNATVAPQKQLVLVAEDSAPNRKILVTLLMKMNYAVVETQNGAEAWTYLEANPDQEITAIITDVMMPEMNGIELLERVRASDRLKELPVVICSAVTDKDNIVRAKELNVNGYLLKPIRAEGLYKKMSELFPANEELKKFAKLHLVK